MADRETPAGAVEALAACSVDVERLRCGRCGDELLPDDLTGHLASEGRGAVDVERWQRIETAARRLWDIAADDHVALNDAYAALRDALGEG